MIGDGWAKVGKDHDCAPAGWKSYPDGSRYWCPTCHELWVVRRPSPSHSRCEPAEPGEYVAALLMHPLALILLAVIASAAFVVVLIG